MIFIFDRSESKSCYFCHTQSEITNPQHTTLAINVSYWPSLNLILSFSQEEALLSMGGNWPLVMGKQPSTCKLILVGKRFQECYACRKASWKDLNKNNPPVKWTITQEHILVT